MKLNVNSKFHKRNYFLEKEKEGWYKTENRPKAVKLDLIQ